MRSFIGLNLPGLRPTDRGAVFNEATCSAAWFSTPDNKTPLPLAQVNAAGYPASDFCWQLFYKCPPAAYNGTYAVEIDGTVTGIAGMSSPLKVGPVVRSVDGKTRATITVNAVAPATASMTLKFTGVANVTKIRIWRGDPPADGQRRWNPVALDLLKNANVGIIRGMEYRRINNPARDATPESPMFTYAGPDDTAYLGAPIELFFDACNETGADCWFNVRIDSTDDEVAAEFATARDRLRPDVFFRIELHNELWNNKLSFKRGHDIAQQRGKELAAAGELGFKGITDPNVLGWRYTAFRAVKLVELARKVFGPDQAYRVRGTLAGQMWDNRPLDEGRKLLRERNAKPSDYFDTYAAAAYFGTARADVESTIAALPADALAAVSHHEADQFFQACAEDGIEPRAYEAGTGFEGSAEFLSAVLGDPRIKGVNTAALDAWRGRGGKHWCKFTSWGDWGKSAYAATTDTTWQSPTLQAFAEYGPTWPYADVPVKPDQRDAEIASLKQQLTASEAGLEAVRGNLREVSAALATSQAVLAESRASEAAAKAEAAKRGGQVERIKAVANEQ